MYFLEVSTINGMKEEIVYNVNDFPYTNLQFIEKCKKNNKQTYYNISATFDIESTTQYRKALIKEENKVIWQRAFMYHWQFCINNKVIFGRTWEEFRQLLDNLRYHMDLTNKTRLCIYIHNLAYEFQFIKDFLNIENLFAKDIRKPLKVYDNGIEFRCSYSLSNMSLVKFCESSKLCTHYKLIDTFDYSKIRTPATELTIEEQGYCYNDVRGLAQCIDTLLEDDTIATIPLTNTGYVRREFRESMKRNPQNWYNFQKTKLSTKQYILLKNAFRGGNTHANRFFANTIINDVYSYDLQSSYPACMMLDYYPLGKFTDVTLNNQYKLDYYTKNYCVVMEITMYDVSTKNGVVIPYIPIAKCTKKSNIVNDNGRIVSADFIQMTITEIDLQIIRNTYNYSGLIVINATYSKRGKLPIEFKEKLMDYYIKKTTLKGVEGQEYFYGKSKNRINSSYGMLVTALVHDEITYNKEWEKTSPELQESIDSFYKSRNNFLSYQWGVYVTAHARRRLQEMIDVVGNDVIYIDTDSIKFIDKKHKKEFEHKNNEIIKQCNNCEIPAYADKDGERYFLGIWDKDGDYTRFKTLGAKKYCYEYHDKKTDKLKFEITVSGMNKKKGTERVGKIENFNIGERFEDIGRTTSWYNEEQPHKITVDNCTFTTASNIGIVETTYKMGITDEYWEIINIPIEML